MEEGRKRRKMLRVVNLTVGGRVSAVAIWSESRLFAFVFWFFRESRFRVVESVLHITFHCETDVCFV